MLGAIIGDFIGSSWEGAEPFRFQGELANPASSFTDDTVLTITTAYAWATGQEPAAKYRETILDYSSLGFSEALLNWAEGVDEQQHFNTGNGAAIRVSPVVLFADSLDHAIELARTSAAATHYHPLAILQAELAGSASFLAHLNHSPSQIRRFAANRYAQIYRLPRLEQPWQWQSVTTAVDIACSTRSFESCMRACISAGGDVDSVCAMAGAISEGLWGCPPQLQTRVLDALERQHPDLFRMLKVALAGRLQLPGSP